MIYRTEPLSWYIDKLVHNEPFASLVYGDGELVVALGRATGTSYTGYHELVTPRMVQEMCDSFIGDSPDVLRGTDFNVLNSKYHDSGRLEAPLEQLLGERHKSLEWLDGVVWEDAVRVGDLNPLLRVLKKKRVVLIGNKKLNQLYWLGMDSFYAVPNTNAYEAIDDIERDLLSWEEPYRSNVVYIMCMGLGAIPLICRLRKKMPTCTFLDLGSCFDVFVGGDSWRAWRKELYADPKRLKEVIDKNLEGL